MSGAGRGRLPEAAYAAALASLPGVGPAWLARLLAASSPSEAWRLVVEGGAEDLWRKLRKGPGRDARGISGVAQRLDVGGLWSRCLQGHLAVTWLGAPGYPTRLGEAQPPAGVVFVAGPPAILESGPAVAVIGTRRCTPEGAEVAWRLGYDLAQAGVVVVSGLALGIDGAAHAGALAAAQDVQAARAGTTVGVAASGPDVVYPRQHAALWREMERHGAILSETPPGTPAQAWRFPARNRLIAALAQMVVVVECHASGGSWHTVDAAMRLGREVGAVPGPVLSSASVGTNMLLHEGAMPVRSALDVLDVLGLAGAPRRSHRSPRGPDGAAAMASRGLAKEPVLQPAEPALSAVESEVLAALGWRPLCLEDLIERSSLPPGPVVLALERLEQLGIVTSESGWWYRGAPRHSG